MKPWEETWEYSSHADDGVQIFVPDGDEGELVAEHGWQRSDVPISRVKSRGKLAACAPEMARMLLWAVNQPGDEREWLFSDDEREQIKALLRKAGVRE